MKKQEIKQEITENPPIGQFLNDLFTEGTNILKQAKILKERGRMFIANTTLLDDFELKLLDALHERYFNWRYKIKELLEKEEVAKKIDSSISYKFFKILNTPWSLGKLGHRDIKTCESQKLLDNIKIDTEKILDFLDETKPKLVETKLGKLFVRNRLEINHDSGDAVYGKTKTTFGKNTAEYKLLFHFLKNKNIVITKKEALWVLSQDSRDLSFYSQEVKYTINNIRKKLEMSGKNKKNEDLFEPMGNGSYRLNCTG